MPLIDIVTPEQATGEVARIYDEIREAIGFVPDGLQLLATSPHQLRRMHREIGYFMQHPSLSLPLQAFIRLLVAEDQDCDYCVGLNTAILHNGGIPREAIEIARSDPGLAPLEPNERVLLHLAVKAARDSRSIREEDIDHAREVGWSDAEILDAVGLAAVAVSFDILVNSFQVAKAATGEDVVEVD